MEFFRTTWLLRFFVCIMIGLVAVLGSILIYYFSLDFLSGFDLFKKIGTVLGKWKILKWYFIFPVFYIIGEMFCSTGDELLSLYMSICQKEVLLPHKLNDPFEHTLPEGAINYKHLLAIFSEKGRQAAIGYHNSEFHFVLSYTSSGMAVVFIFLALLLKFGFKEKFLIIISGLILGILIFQLFIKVFKISCKICIRLLIFFVSVLLVAFAFGKHFYLEFLFFVFSAFSWHRAYYHKCFANLINYGKWLEMEVERWERKDC